MRSDGERVQCHLCGGWYRMVGGSHLINAHGWTTAEYREAFLLNVTASTVGPVTSERKRKTMREQIARGGRDYPLPKGPRPTPAAWRSLAAARPELVDEWHPSRNRSSKPWGSILGRSGCAPTARCGGAVECVATSGKAALAGAETRVVPPAVRTSCAKGRSGSCIRTCWPNGMTSATGTWTRTWCPRHRSGELGGAARRADTSGQA